jgi:potassium-transporting ATPase KdpC subunit
MLKTIGRSFILLLILVIITGLVYPLLITGVSRLAFYHKSNGSLIYDKEGKLIGSELIGQDFKTDKYFHSRPSAAGKPGYDPLKSGGSNYAAANEDFLALAIERSDKFRQENKLDGSIAIPSDMVTASASGLDPHISVSGALLQVARIASARNIDYQKVRILVTENSGRQYGFLGEPVVNVLKLNLLLDSLK